MVQIQLKTIQFYIKQVTTKPTFKFIHKLNRRDA